MKFAIAAGILAAQSSPAASDNTAVVPADAFIPPGGGSNHHDLLVPQEILSHVMQSPKLQQVLKSKDARRTGMFKKNCDPSSDDPDVGVLSCGLGYECVPHESSILEGQCVQSSRELQAVEFCDLCGFGQLVGYSKDGVPSGYEDFTCGDLAIASYGENVTLTTEQCAESAQFVKAAGCCVSYECDPCGDMTFNGNLTFDDNVCGGVAPLLNDTGCAVYTEYLSNYCCESGGDMMPTTAPASSAVSDIPTPVIPETPTAEDLDTPEAATDSATMRSTSPFVSMMGLVVATAGGLLLN